MKIKLQTAYLQAEFWVLLALIGLIVAVAGCAAPEPPPPAEQQKSAQETANKWVLVTRDGCQYWTHENDAISSAHIYSMCHKGDCNNPIHKYEPTY